jgi:hypothetical protein
VVNALVGAGFGGQSVKAMVHLGVSFTSVETSPYALATAPFALGGYDVWGMVSDLYRNRRFWNQFLDL